MAAILVVDDDPDVRRALRKILERMGYEVRDVGGGREAVDECRQHPPDLALIDMYMPEVDGVQAIRAIKKDAPELRVVAMSGGGRDVGIDMLDIATMLGATRVLHKPFEVDEVMSVVRASLEAA